MCPCYIIDDGGGGSTLPNIQWFSVFESSNLPPLTFPCVLPHFHFDKKLHPQNMDVKTCAMCSCVLGKAQTGIAKASLNPI